MSQAQAPKVGEKIGYSSGGHYSWSAWSLHVALITKTTPGGQVTLENGMKFNKHGQQMKTEQHKYPRAFLVSVADVERIKAADAEQKANAALLNAARGLLNNMHGNMHHAYTDEEKAALQNVINVFGPKPEQPE